MANNSILAAFERMWQHVNTKKADMVHTHTALEVIDIDYEKDLAFDTSEIVITTMNTTSVLGQAVLGQMILA